MTGTRSGFLIWSLLALSMFLLPSCSSAPEIQKSAQIESEALGREPAQGAYRHCDSVQDHIKCKGKSDGDVVDRICRVNESRQLIGVVQYCKRQRLRCSIPITERVAGREVRSNRHSYREVLELQEMPDEASNCRPAPNLSKPQGIQD